MYPLFCIIFHALLISSLSAMEIMDKKGMNDIPAEIIEEVFKCLEKNRQYHDLCNVACSGKQLNSFVNLFVDRHIEKKVQEENRRFEKRPVYGEDYIELALTLGPIGLAWVKRNVNRTPLLKEGLDVLLLKETARIEPDFDRLTFFVCAGANLEGRCNEMTPLMWQSLYGNKKVVHYLLMNNANANNKNKDNTTALSVARISENQEIVELLKRYRAKE